MSAFEFVIILKIGFTNVLVNGESITVINMVFVTRGSVN